MTTGSNQKQTDIMDSPLGVILEIIIVLGILFAVFILPIILNAGKGSVEQIYDNSKELEAQDRKASEQVRDYERQQQNQERQDEYNDYLEWVNSGRP